METTQPGGNGSHGAAGLKADEPSGLGRYVPIVHWLPRYQRTWLRADAIATELRRHDPPIVCRIRDEALVFDPRTLEADDAEQVAGALGEVVREMEGR